MPIDQVDILDMLYFKKKLVAFKWCKISYISIISVRGRVSVERPKSANSYQIFKRYVLTLWTNIDILYLYGSMTTLLDEKEQYRLVKC